MLSLTERATARRLKKLKEIGPAKLLADPEVRKRFEERLAYYRKLDEPRIRAIRNAERITAADLAVTINARDDD